ncbi:hypothetical protein G9E11_19985 [Arthrobacter sp. IA7]|uniref:hypothetical protein n=1 Tax=Arthrobacter ipis TaxID=2716202 RepID=UPI00168410F5|nr:hypothetical protein [Arthrobacter ipis]MBD1544477.1 hypothetical protein [Arthrobacter ipis]
MGVPDGHLAGILAWYSLIHFEPAELPLILGEFARCVKPGGSVLLGFFDGPAGEPFPHASVVHAFLADGLNNPQWRSGVQSIALKDCTSGESGAVYSQALTGPKGRPLQGDYKITDA